MDDRPQVVVLAGPNGAGKTTAAPHLIRDALGIEEFVNADTIAQGLSSFSPQRVNFAAGRIMLTRLRELAKRRATFAFETTLASRAFAPWLRTLREHGYLVDLHFLWLAAPEVAIDRVQQRVKKGGHHVPTPIIRQRYERGLRNFFELYTPIVDVWQIYDNTGADPRLIACGDQVGQSIRDETTWSIILRQASES